MARDGRGKPLKGVGEQEEMTVVILRFKGGGDTLRKGFDTVTHALSALAAPVPHEAIADHRREPVTPGSGGEPELDAEEAQEPDDLLAGGNGGSSRPRRKPSFLSDFDLAPEGQVPWKEFAASKAPKTLEEKYLVAAAWVTKHGGVETFTLPHIFTCFRAMKWEEQADFSQPIRRMKADDSYFDSPERRKWKLTGLGLEAADRLPRAELNS